ncbi:hypothetical protein KDM87_00345 [Undibacterium sp. FT147W]|uniref:Lipoprotein n=1 Tax=Undibacterium rivi TaxID=2828729 RepID=A0ABS5GXB7_9BURK|nr:hypothetical protein [Undibacterium rivi]MBR7791028.1 hypothetical protein [Undibacterium rivi]
MKNFKICTVIFVVALSACATVPPESVSLSSEIGNGIKKQSDAQINLINLYFEAKRKELDAALQKALTKYFSTITPGGSVTLTASQLADISSDVIALNGKNDAAKEALEKVRVGLVSKIEDNYLVLNQANTTITGLLQSAVSVKDSTNKSIQLVSSATGGKIQLDKVFSEIDSFVQKGGVDAGKAIDLNNKIQNFINN